MIERVLSNLIENALRHTPEGGRITVTLHLQSNGVGVRIADTGDGIPAEELPHVFDRFFRGDASHNSAVDGCGLGLSIAQWIAAAHHGSVKLESAPGKLTTVTVRLPLAS